jgi:hypothetical protein
MASTDSPYRTPRLRKNPLYKLIRFHGWKVNAIAKAVGYDSLSAFYKVLRFEVMPTGDKLEKIGLLFDPPLSAGEVFDIWNKERAA